MTQSCYRAVEAEEAGVRGVKVLVQKGEQMLASVSSKPAFFSVLIFNFLFPILSVSTWYIQLYSSY